MKKLFQFSFLFSLFSILSYGQGFFEKVDMGIDKIKYSKLDTNYIAPPDYKLMVAVESKSKWMHNNIHIPFSWSDDDLYAAMPEIKDYEKMKIKSRTDQTALGFRVSYQGLAAGYAVSLGGSTTRHTFSLGSNANRFGFKLGFERNSLNNASFRDTRLLPYLYIALQEELPGVFTLADAADILTYKREDIELEDIDLDTFWALDDIVQWYGNFYYAFNYRKFSMSAANYAQYIQKRSAGSFFVTGDISYNRMHAKNMMWISEEDGKTSREKFSSFAVALGAGYGYNWTPNHGKFLLHGSLRPTLNAYSRMDYDCWDENGNKVDPSQEDGGEMLDPLFDKKMKLTLGGVTRVAAVWNISPRFVAGANAEYTIRDCSNKSDYRMYNSRLNLNAYFAMRFIHSKKQSK